jgi:hypothetical protein
MAALGTAFSAASALPASAAVGTNDCVAVPSACGYPDTTNTGVPAGMTLQSVPAQVTRGRGWYWNPRGWVEVNGKGAVLSGLSIQGDVDVSASNVTVSDDQIVNGGRGSFGVSLRHARNVTIENCTISGTDPASGRLMVGIKDINGDTANTNILGNNIYFTSTGVHLSSGLIAGNYIHDMGYLPGDHLNGITSDSGTKLLTISDNTIFNAYNQTDAVSLFQDFGPQGNRVITGNLLAGGGYTIYAGGKTNGPPAFNVQITNNRISTMYFPTGGQYGPVAFYSHGHGNVWSGNTWDDSGQPILAPSIERS